MVKALMNLFIVYLFTDRCIKSWNAAFYFIGYSLWGRGNILGLGRVRALNCAVRVKSDDLGYRLGSGFNFKPVQTSNKSAKRDIFRHLEQLRAMNKHDETALAAFHFLYSTSTKNIDAYSSSLLL